MDLWKKFLATGGCCWLSWRNGCWEWRPLGIADRNLCFPLCFDHDAFMYHTMHVLDAPEVERRKGRLRLSRPIRVSHYAQISPLNHTRNLTYTFGSGIT